MIYLHLVTLRTIEVRLIMQNLLSNEPLLNRCGIEVFSRPYCCNPLSVLVGRKVRLVLNLSIDPLILSLRT